MVTKEQIDRINELAHKAKAEGLTAEETRERDQLRKAYIASFRENLKSQLEQIDFVDENGNRVSPKGVQIEVRQGDPSGKKN